MNALISGRANAAILIEKEEISVLRSEQAEPAVCHASALPHLIGDARDLIFLENVTQDEAARALEHATDCESALHLSLITLDGKLSAKVRAKAADALEEFLEDTAVLDYICGVFHARPLTGDSDIGSALDAAGDADAVRVFDLWRQIRRRQPLIEEAWLAWEAIDPATFQVPRDGLRAALVRAGMFTALVTARETNKVGGFLVDALLHPQFKVHRQVLQHWTAPLRAIQRPALVLETDDAEDWQGGKGRKAKRRTGGLDTFNRVESQKAAIVKLIQERDVSRARQFIVELIEDQMQNGGAEYAAKSLCDLAMEAKSVGLLEFQLELTEQSVQLKPDDGWAWAQHGDALLNSGRFDEADYAFIQADIYSEDAIGKKGRAEVLKVLGRLDEALTAYEQAIEDFPHDEVARRGRVGVLLALGRLDEALDSLPQHEPKTPDDWIALHMRGMILLAMRKTKEAIRVFRRGVEECPIVSSQSYFRSALAMAQLRRRNFTGAAEVLEAEQAPLLQFPVNVLRIHAYGALGQRDKAQAAYGKVLQFPSNYLTQRSEELVQELYHRFLNGQTSKHDDDWVDNEEFELLMAA
ncbi:MAG TPA: tetratricopeptide repeat protein [Abditibacteriaceae bacterium]